MLEPRRVGELALICLLTVVAVPADADWIRGETENFVFLGDIGERDAVKLLDDLEIYRSTILALTGTDYFPEVRKVHVYGFKQYQGVRDVVGLWLGGIYTNNHDHPIIVTVAGRRHGEDYSVVLHEFAHHVLNGLATDYYPRWYDEGFAQYLASFQVDDDIVTIGAPNVSRAGLLNRPRWIDIETVLSSITKYPYEGSKAGVDGYRFQMFYAVSWIAVHYLQNTPELNSGFSDYIALLNDGTEPLEAFETGFGLTPDEFEERLYRYRRANQLPVVQFRMTDNFVTSKVQVTRVSDEQSEVALVLPSVLFVSTEPEDKKERDRIRRGISDLLQEHGEIGLYQALMYLELAASDYDAAVAAGEQAISIAHQDPLAIQTLADALYHRYVEGETKNIRDISRARSLFRSQLEIDPENLTANKHYPQAVLLEGEEPDELSIQAVIHNLRHRPSPIYTETYLDAAEILTRAGQPESGCLLLDKIGTWVNRFDEEMTEEDRSKLRELNRETDLERFNRIAAELGDSCS